VEPSVFEAFNGASADVVEAPSFAWQGGTAAPCCMACRIDGQATVGPIGYEAQAIFALFVVRFACHDPVLRREDS